MSPKDFHIFSGIVLQGEGGGLVLSC